MKGSKILVLCEDYQGGEKSVLGLALLEAAEKCGISREKMKASLKNNEIITEELKGKEWSEILKTSKEIGSVLIVGASAYNKVEVQNLKDFRYAVIPQPRAWDDEVRVVVMNKLYEFMKPTLSEDTKPEPIIETPKEIDKSPSEISDMDIETLSAFLQTEVHNSRMQACVFNWNQDGGELLVKNAGLNLHIPIESLVPILVSDEVLKSESKMKDIRDSLAASGYKNPYLMPIREFMLLIRIYQILAKERKLTLQLTM